MNNNKRVFGWLADSDSLLDARKYVESDLAGTLRRSLQGSQDTAQFGNRLCETFHEFGRRDVASFQALIGNLLGEAQKIYGARSGTHLPESSSEIAGLKNAVADFRHQAMTDGLTQVVNLKRFDLRMQERAQERRGAAQNSYF